MRYSLLLLGLVFCPFLFAQTGTQTTDTILHNGIPRPYLLYVPQSYSGQEDVPLVIELHGYTSNMSQQIIYGDFRKIADTANFILAVPNGRKDGNGNRYWNFGQVSGGSDDIGFLSDLIDSLQSHYTINLNRVYFTGLSNGGFMSNYLACNLSQKVTAIASVSGTLMPFQLSGCVPSKPIPALHIHGTTDPVVPYAGMTGEASAESLIAHWVSVDQCDPTPIVQNLPDTDPNDNCTVTHYIYPDGQNGATVEFYKIIGGGHTWPDAPIDINTNGNTNHDFNASKQIWRFFSQYDAQELLSVKKETITKTIRVYPNPSTNSIYIQSSHPLKKIRINNGLGKTVRRFDKPKMKLTLSHLSPGLYYINAVEDNTPIHQKFIIKK